MNPRLTALIERRARLTTDIERERANVRSTYAVIRRDMVYASVGLAAGRLLASHTWLRTIVSVALAIIAGTRLASQSKL
jgi:hypothetical protein